MHTKPTHSITHHASRITVYLLLVLFACCLSASAQTTAFTYQGRLNDGANIATGIYDLRFAIYDAAGGGTRQGVVLTNSATAVSNGLFTVALDFGNQFPGAGRWLELAVRTNGNGAFSTLTPRQPLTAAPYAVQAVNAATAVSATAASSAASVPASGIGAGTANINITGNAATATAAVSATTAQTATTALTAGAATNVLGILPDVQLSTNIARLNGTNLFTGTNRFAGVVVATNMNNVIYGAFTGNASGLTNLNASQMTGTISSNNIAVGGISAAMLATGAVGSNQLAADAVTTSALANGAVTAGKVATVTNWFALTIANPTPAISDYFGCAVAAVGPDKVLIGAESDDTGASGAGAAYLYGTNGILITTFTNPTPALGDNFGVAVAAVGTDKVLIGAESDDTGAVNAGAVYLFNTNGTLITTFTNPTPSIGEFFGNAVAAMEIDKVLIGAAWDNVGPAAGAGAAYLFNTNGALITTFTNPTPALSDHFGIAVAAVGTDKVLVGADADDTSAPDSGIAYLFNTNGMLITTFTNPTPASLDYFGIAVAAVGTDKVLIGAEGDDLGAASAGAAYLFNTNGTLIATITNPVPAVGDNFGCAVSAIGAERLLIGAINHDAGAVDAGAAFLFEAETYTPGLVADSVSSRAVTTGSLEDGAVTAVKIGGVLYSGQIPNLDASKIASGTFSLALLPAEVVTNNESGVTLSGTFNGNATTATTATNLVGNLLDSQLSTNIARLNGTNLFTGTNRFAGVVIATNVNNVFAGTFTGSGSGLTISGSNSIVPGSITGALLAPGAVTYLGSPDGSPTNALAVSTNGLVGIGTTNTPVAGLEITTGATLYTLSPLFEVQNNLGGYTNLNSAYQIALNGSLLAVGSDSGVTLVKLLDPSTPTLRAQLVNGVGSFTNLNTVAGLAWAGSNLVAGAQSSDAVTIIGCTNPASPVKLAELRHGVGGWNYLDGVSSVAVRSNLLAIGAYNSHAVTLADISNPSAPVLRGFMVNGLNGFTNLGSVNSVALSGNLLAIAAYSSNAVTLVDVTDPANPQKLAEMRNGVSGYNLNGAVSVALSGSVLAIASMVSATVTLVDISTPSSPVKLAELRDGVDGFELGSVYAVAISSNLLAIASLTSATVTLVDISNPASPKRLAVAKDGLNGADYLDGSSGVDIVGTNVFTCSLYDDAYTIFGVGSQSAGLTSAGWVGIGTTLPAAPLNVVGNVLVQDADLFNVTATHLALGYGANASGPYALAMGYFATALGNESTALGYYTTASGGVSTAMGYFTTASGSGSTAMGSYTTASGSGSTAMGSYTTASGDHSMALGYYSAATNRGTFVWADSSSFTPFSSTATNQFLVRATGGVGINTNNPRTALHVNGTITATNYEVTANASTSTNTSIGQVWRDNTVVAWARVNAIGTSAEKFGVTSVTNNSQGVYTITLNDSHLTANTLVPVANAELDASPTTAAAIRIISVNQTLVNQFQVFINNGNWSPTNNDFVFIVTGR